MNSVVNQYRHFAFGGPLAGIKTSLRAHQHQVQRVVGVGRTRINQLKHRGVGVHQPAVVVHHLEVGRRFQAVAAFKNRFKRLRNLIFFWCGALLRPSRRHRQGHRQNH